MKNKIFYLLLAFVSAVLLLSCMSVSKHLEKSFKKDKQLVAKITRDSFPCITVKSDTLKISDTLYEIIDVKCPENGIDSFETTIAVKVPYKIIEKVFITNNIEDSSKIFEMNSEIIALNVFMSEKDIKILELSTKITEKELIIEKKNKKILWLIFFIFGLSIPYIFRLLKFFKFI
jgi:hypothetical protein